MPLACRIGSRAAFTVVALALSPVAGASTQDADVAQSYPLPPGRSGLYGGGAVRDYLHFVSLRIQPGGALIARATLVTKCTPRFGDQLTESITVRNGRLDGNGLYRSTTSFTDRVDTGVPLTGGLFATGTISFSARVNADGRAHGTARVRTKYSRSERGPAVSTCDTGPIRWMARRPPADAGAGHPALQPGTHRGTTSQDAPFLMRAGDRGRLVRRAGLTVRVDCRSAIGLPLDVVARRMRVRRGGFGGAGGFTRPYTDPDGRRVVERYAWELRGRFGRRGARGTFELTGVVRRRSDGRKVGSCATGEIAWRAVR